MFSGGGVFDQAEIRSTGQLCWILKSTLQNQKLQIKLSSELPVLKSSVQLVGVEPIVSLNACRNQISVVSDKKKANEEKREVGFDFGSHHVDAALGILHLLHLSLPHLAFFTLSVLTGSALTCRQEAQN